MRRGVSAWAVALLAAGGGSVVAAPVRAAVPMVPTSQPLVVLLHDHLARTGPGPHARLIESVLARRPLTGAPTVLPVIGTTAGSGGSSWMHVRLPGRPSGHTGWIAAHQIKRTYTGWHIAVDLSARRVTVSYAGRTRRRFLAVVGKPSTPTPQGRFFVEEALALSIQDPGGPFALATSARSDVLQEFDGGPGQIALHGTNNLSGTLGTAVSHGCIRLATGDISWLARRIGSGVPVTIAS